MGCRKIQCIRADTVKGVFVSFKQLSFFSYNLYNLNTIEINSKQKWLGLNWK